MRSTQLNVDEFLKSAEQADEMPMLSGAGLYAFVLKDRCRLPGIDTDSSAVLYLGMTNDGLAARNHFNHPHSGFSTLRRSLGALLQDQLALVAIPRAPGSSKTNVRNYRFTDDGEKRLTEWMRSNMLIAQAEVETGLEAVERELIAQLEPILCLTGWDNPQRRIIKMLRAKLVQEAESNRV